MQGLLCDALGSEGGWCASRPLILGIMTVFVFMPLVSLRCAAAMPMKLVGPSQHNRHPNDCVMLYKYQFFGQNSEHCKGATLPAGT